MLRVENIIENEANATFWRENEEENIARESG